MLFIGQRARLLVLSVLLLFLALMGAGLTAQQVQKQPQSEAALKKQLNSNEAERQRVQQRLRETKRKDQKVSRDLRQINRKRDDTKSRLQAVTQDERETQSDLKTATSQLAQAKAELQDRQEIVADRLVSVYKEGDTSPLQVVLLAQDFRDFSDRLYLLNTLAERDVEILNELDAAKESAVNKQQEVINKERLLTAKQQEYQVQKSHYDAQQQRKTREQREVRKVERKLERELDELEATRHDITLLIRRAQGLTRGGGAVITPWQGKLIRPVAGRITSGYGNRMHPILRKRRFR